MLIETNNIKVPPFLNGDFFNRALEEGLRVTHGCISKIIFEMGSGAGDNYCSSIYRVKLVFKRNAEKPEEELSVIIKCIPITDETQFLQDLDVFLKEKSIYKDVIPRLEILLNDTTFGAKLYYAIREPIQTIAFEDLKVQGFSTAVRQDGLNLEHCNMVLKKLGKFHAASMVLAKKDPSVLDHYDAGMLSSRCVENSDIFKKMFGSQLKYLSTNVVPTWPGYEKIAVKLGKYYENFTKNVVNCGNRRDDDISVLIHGDLWTNNFMFKYDGDDRTKPLDVFFVDFQLSYYTSLGCDINFFLNSSVQLDILETKRDSLVETYYKEFRNALEELRFDNIPSLEDVRKQVRSRERYGLFSMFGFLPMVTLDPELSKDSSIESMSDESQSGKKMEQMFKNPKLVAELKYSLKRFDDLGILDEDYIESI